MAETDEADVQTKKSKTLIVRHLPRELNRDEKEDLLKYFGASAVRVLSEKGPLKHMAFATFSSETSASKALNRLHQLRILGHTLVVEFAKDQDSVSVLKDPPVSNSGAGAQAEKGKKEKQQHNVPMVDNSIAPSLGLKFQTNPTLKYLYPPPSSGILTNIIHTLLSVPKFYVQVLHLMNKMNLPCPFGPVTARPPMFEMPPGPLPPMPPPFPPENPPLPEHEEGASGSEEESEYESGDEEDKERMIRLMGLVNQPCKRPLRAKTSSKRKKPKLKDLLFIPKPDSHGPSGPALQPADVFEQPQTVGQKKIEFHISAEASTILEGPGQNQEPQFADATEDTAEKEVSAQEAAEGFGKIYPSAQVPRQEEEREEDEDIPSEFISRRELERGRLSRDEIKKMSVFKNYEPGEPTCRLYVKNIAKQVEEKDLKFIYGRYIDISSEEERNMFDIVLMREGRMKGQAFIGLPSERSAEKALKETNGYILNDKPLVVQFARSAKPKQESADPKKGGKKH
ncbi:RNA-binding region-containing protein 3 [Ctenopharyngodon idella]|uniref:RNA-binding region-containing protein 3 n=1 Tax=Ctenopharyngodon idella TaxID=7959 RepID=UPI00222E4506|nr:RNA-binding region-containing protein 3 [Ctenopharyngodon idella]XP_051738483.1 RNA-binding region-containing protein 3 [Ctenopharyngodon idella]XP_051738485.1 RNA-binding region-containing protein 3 [Ctenopharyngodon idella]